VTLRAKNKRLLQIAEEVFSILMAQPNHKRIGELQRELLELYPDAEIRPLPPETGYPQWIEPKFKNKIPRPSRLSAVAAEIVAKWNKK
jgi:hypothetical protein